MRKLVISILCMILLVPVFYLNLVYVYYQLQKEVITQNYCVNLPLEEVPTCWGKCFITGLVAQNNSPQDAAPLPVVEDKTSTFHVAALAEVIFPSLEEALHALYIPDDLHLPPQPFAHSIFHPPRV